MKYLLVLCLTLCCCAPCFSQPFEWTWINGPNVVGNVGNLGTLGQAAPTNLPGDRDGGCSWTDVSGNLWLFGGEGVEGASGGYLNDLWKYDPSTNEWTWMGGGNTANQPGVYGTKGVPATGNIPSARVWAASWTDKAGNFWLFGGAINEMNVKYLNDLWMFNPQTDEWTWVAGTSTPGEPAVYGTQGVPSTNNLPPSMCRAIHWTDHNGIFWLYGGESAATTESDLWKFDPTTGAWTWVNGNHAPGSNLPVYGTKKVAAHTNTPAGRIDAPAWVDASNNLWLFGASPGGGLLNDLWKYDPVLNEWTWMSGDNTDFNLSVPGTQGVAAATNKPSCRYGSAGWADDKGKLWLFGGIGMGTNPEVSAADPLNDLWSYDIATDQWTWVSGSTAPDGIGIYGTKGIPAPGNTPGGRIWPITWTDANYNFWLFGGGGYASVSRNEADADDLWAFKAPSLITIAQVSPLNVCPGGTLAITFFASGLFAAGNVFTAELSDAQGGFGNPVSIGTLTAGAGVGEVINATIPASTPGGNGYRVRVVATSPAVSSPDNGVDITVFSPATPGIQASGPETICPGSPITLMASASGGNPPYRYSWSTGATTQTITVSPGSDAAFILSVIDGCGTTKDTTQVTMVPVKPVTLGGDAGLCPNTTLLLDAHAGYASYAWQDGTTDSILMVSEPGTYSITVTDLCSRSSSDAVVITGLPGPATPFLPADTSVCQYGGLVVVPEYSFSAYQWSTGEHTPQITIDQPGQYWLEVTNSDGCTARDTIEVGVRNCFEAFRMPNAFTPNGDGNNDVLHPVFFGPVKQFRLQVFDRWGQKVFETTQLRQGWDGRILGNPPMPGTFVWVCEYQLEGLPATWAKGTVLLIR